MWLSHSMKADLLTIQTHKSRWSSLKFQTKQNRLSLQSQMHKRILTSSRIYWQMIYLTTRLMLYKQTNNLICSEKSPRYLFLLSLYLKSYPLYRMQQSGNQIILLKKTSMENHCRLKRNLSLININKPRRRITPLQGT